MRIKFNGKVFNNYEDANNELNEVRATLTEEDKKNCTWDIDIYEERILINAVRIAIAEEYKHIKDIIDDAEPRFYIPGNKKSEKWYMYKDPD